MSVQQVGSPSVVRLGFGPFELNVAERSLKKANRNIPLGGRAYDILIALLENAGETVSKAELIAKVWPDVTVEEGGLRVHLSALRKALGDGQFGDKYIANIQGHGYRFIAPVTRLPAERDRDSASAGLSNLPPALGRMVGRGTALDYSSGRRGNGQDNGCFGGRTSGVSGLLGRGILCRSFCRE
jgi:DNA-binding winged helix-turn-helix (wHTH) protein